MMTDEITEAIKKLELYQQQIKEQTKKEILNFVANFDDNYYLYPEEDEAGRIVTKIDYYIDAINKIQKAITFLNFNYNPEFIKKIERDLHYSPVVSLNDGGNNG